MEGGREGEKERKKEKGNWKLRGREFKGSEMLDILFIFLTGEDYSETKLFGCPNPKSAT